jgi:hypothetical protein
MDRNLVSLVLAIIIAIILLVYRYTGLGTAALGVVLVLISEASPNLVLLGFGLIVLGLVWEGISLCNVKMI